MLSSLGDLLWTLGVLLDVIPVFHYKRYMAAVEISVSLSYMLIGFLFLTARPRKGWIIGGLVIGNIVFAYGWLMVVSMLGF